MVKVSTLFNLVEAGNHVRNYERGKFEIRKMGFAAADNADIHASRSLKMLRKAHFLYETFHNRFLVDKTTLGRHL